MLEDKLVELLREVATAFQWRLQEMSALEDLKLAHFQGRLIAAIGRKPGISQQELAYMTGRDKGQVARTIKELDARGLVTRSAHEKDWRTQCLCLTKEGESASALLHRQRTELSTEMLSELSAEEMDALHRSLLKMKRQVTGDNRD